MHELSSVGSLGLSDGGFERTPIAQPSSPTDVHNGTATTTTTKRQTVLDAAYQANPTRFRNKPPTATQLPAEAWINKPTIHTTP